MMQGSHVLFTLPVSSLFAFLGIPLDQSSKRYTSAYWDIGLITEITEIEVFPQRLPMSLHDLRKLVIDGQWTAAHSVKDTDGRYVDIPCDVLIRLLMFYLVEAMLVSTVDGTDNVSPISPSGHMIMSNAGLEGRQYAMALAGVDSMAESQLGTVSASSAQFSYRRA
jgi:hypothetical protein